MSARRPGRILAKGLLVVAGVAAGAVAGAFLGSAYTILLLPNAGLEGIVPPVVGTFAGSAVGAFVALAALLKVPRPQREHAAAAFGVAAVLLVLGIAGFVVTNPDSPDPGWATIARSGLGLGPLTGIGVLASTLYGPQRSPGAG